MTKREEFHLEFQILNINNWGKQYSCLQYIATNESFYLSDLLNQIRDKSPQYLLDEINNALNGLPFDDYITPDGSNGGVDIIPPNALINDDFEISLSDLKILLEEWIDFINSNPF